MRSQDVADHDVRPRCMVPSRVGPVPRRASCCQGSGTGTSPARRARRTSANRVRVPRRGRSAGNRPAGGTLFARPVKPPAARSIHCLVLGVLEWLPPVRRRCSSRSAISMSEPTAAGLGRRHDRLTTTTSAVHGDQRSSRCGSRSGHPRPPAEQISSGRRRRRASRGRPWAEATGQRLGRLDASPRAARSPLGWVRPSEARTLLGSGSDTGDPFARVDVSGREY